MSDPAWLQDDRIFGPGGLASFTLSSAKTGSKAIASDPVGNASAPATIVFFKEPGVPKILTSITPHDRNASGLVFAPVTPEPWLRREGEKKRAGSFLIPPQKLTKMNDIISALEL